MNNGIYIRHAIRAYPLLNSATEEVERLHPEIGSMRVFDAFKLIADYIGLDVNSCEEIRSTLNRAEEYLQSKQK